MNKNFFNKTGVLIANLGTPDTPTSSAVRHYLSEFLWDPRVVEIPRIAWWFILRGLILPLRPRRSAAAYQRVWTDQGSPLLSISKQQLTDIEIYFGEQTNHSICFALGMRYGNPSISQALKILEEQQIDRLIVLPLYPQYSAVTTGSTFDAISNAFKTSRWLPEINFINHYYRHPLYINALVEAVREHWRHAPQEQKLLFSFHGIPQRNVDQGDPYAEQCHHTATTVAQQLGLNEQQWQIVFQSRFGRAKWLQPYCAQTLMALPKEGCTRVAVICPGFAADCLETLDEMANENHHLFLEAGGEVFNYIPALNASLAHIKLLATLIEERL